MNNQFIKEGVLPFCKGCGHSSIAKNTEKALEQLGLDTLDVVLVTDIGCHGIIDKSFNTHTVHGLHGRSIALAAGVSTGLNNPDKKVLVFIGDGGATIGMQHLIDAAHNNFNMTVVIHNNMLYGMTGGQPSEFTPHGFKTPTQVDPISKAGYDICEVITAAGASYVRRLTGVGNFSGELAEAIEHPGFSLIEIMEICPSYGVKSNPGMKLSKVVEAAGLKTELFVKKENGGYATPLNPIGSSLISERDVIPHIFPHQLQEKLKVMLCGSAGEGVQQAAELLAKIGISTGLNVTKKGSYPVTVGIGFSAAEVILSPEPIHYTGTVVPDVMIITSEDGLKFGMKKLLKMKKGVVVYDDSLSMPELEGVTFYGFNFRERAGFRSASLMGLLYFLDKMEVVPEQAIFDTFNQSKLSKKVDLQKLRDFS